VYSERKSVLFPLFNYSDLLLVVWLILVSVGATLRAGELAVSNGHPAVLKTRLGPGVSRRSLPGGVVFEIAFTSLL